MINDQVIILVN